MFKLAQLFILTICLTTPTVVSYRISPFAPFYGKPPQSCLKDGRERRKEGGGRE